MKKIYLSPERRPAPHGPYFGYPTLFEHDVTTSIAQKTAAALKAPPRRGINPIPFMSRKRGRRKSGVLALHFGAPGMGNN